jgi:hypothetical protein
LTLGIDEVSDAGDGIEGEEEEIDSEDNIDDISFDFPLVEEMLVIL